jgi:hypothetical protein
MAAARTGIRARSAMPPTDAIETRAGIPHVITRRIRIEPAAGIGIDRVLRGARPGCQETLR